MFHETSANQPLKVFVSYDRVKDQLYRNYFDILFEGSKEISVVNSPQIGVLGGHQDLSLG